MSDIFYGADIPCYLLTENETLSDIGAAGDISSVIHSEMNLSEAVFIPQSDIHQEENGTVDSSKLFPLLTVTSTFRKPCNCAKSHCLKLYCECFARGNACENCNCTNCLNNTSHEEERRKAIKLTLERNPLAFHPKIEVIEAACSCMIAQLTEVQIVSTSPIKHERTIIEEFGRCLEQIIDSALKLKKGNGYSPTQGIGEVDHNLVSLISNYNEPCHTHYGYKGIQPQLGYSSMISPDATILRPLQQNNGNHEADMLSSGNHTITCVNRINDEQVYQKTMETTYETEDFTNMSYSNYEMHPNNSLQTNVLKVYQEPYACISTSDLCGAYNSANNCQFVDIDQSGFVSQLPSIAFNYTGNQSNSITDDYQTSKAFYSGPLTLSDVGIAADRCTNAASLTENLHLSQKLGAYTNRLEEPSGTVLKSLSHDASDKFHQPFKHILNEGNYKNPEFNEFAFCSQATSHSMLSKALTYEEPHPIEDDEHESNQATAALLHATSIYDCAPSARFSINPDLDLSEMTEIGSVVDSYSADMIPLSSPVSAFPPRLHSRSAFHLVPEDSTFSSTLMASSSGVSGDLGQAVLKPELGFYDL